MPAVMEVLRKEHRNIARLLGALERQIDVFAEAGDPDYDVLRGVADYFLEFPDRCHHPKEDAVFALLKIAHPQAASAVGDLPREHRLLHEQTLRFHQDLMLLLKGADIARAEIVDAARRFIEDERRHMGMEEEHFFQVSERLLTPADWSMIEGELAKGRDPLFGGKVEERFRKLSETLIAWEAEFH